MTPADCFTVGLLKGAMEGDETAHFGSLLGFEAHLLAAQEVGVVDATASPTEQGRDVYARCGLSDLPPGRAYLWPADLIAPALDCLNGIPIPPSSPEREEKETQ